MRISVEDRALAREIAELFSEWEDQRLMNALAVVLWSHRQRPADDDPGAARGADNRDYVNRSSEGSSL